MYINYEAQRNFNVSTFIHSQLILTMARSEREAILKVYPKTELSNVGTRAQ